MKQPKNDIFIENSTDPTNGKIVKEIRKYKEYFKDKNKTILEHKWDLIWQYYRDRNKKSIYALFRENKNEMLKIIYSGDPKQYIIECPVINNQ